MKNLLQSNSSILVKTNDYLFLRSNLVNENNRVSKKSFFKDPIWLMDEFITVPGSTNYQKKFDFSKISGFSDFYALSLAEYAYARMFNPPDHFDEVVKWPTVFNELVLLRSFVDFCLQNNINSFDKLEKSDFDYYYKHIFEKKSLSRVRTIFVCLNKYFEFKTRLSYPFKVSPLGMSIDNFFGKESRFRGENAIQPIPESIFSPLIKAALEYVDKHSTKLLDDMKFITSLWESAKNTQISHRQDSRLYYKLATAYISELDYSWRKEKVENLNEFFLEIIALRTASTIIVLAFSGIRSSELLSLNYGCLSTNLSEDNSIKYYISGKVYKQHGKGTKETWVVISEVHRAINILQNLVNTIRENYKNSLIFATDSTGRFFYPNHVIDPTKLKELSSAALNHQLNTFKNHVNEKLNCEKIPKFQNAKFENVEWNLFTSQFRRTLARFIARQPFGIIAGMIQYKHVQTTIFEGYAGREKEFNSILNQERDLANIDILKEISIDISNGEISGFGGQKIQKLLDLEFKGRAEDYKPSQIYTWLNSNQKNLFVGKYNFCFFDPDKALCIEGKDDRSKPILNSCAPDKCKNSCITKRHLPLWKAQLDQAENLASFDSSISRKVLLTEEITYLKLIIDNFKE